MRKYLCHEDIVWAMLIAMHQSPCTSSMLGWSVIAACCTPPHTESLSLRVVFIIKGSQAHYKTENIEDTQMDFKQLSHSHTLALSINQPKWRMGVPVCIASLLDLDAVVACFCQHEFSLAQSFGPCYYQATIIIIRSSRKG